MNYLSKTKSLLLLFTLSAFQVSGQTNLVSNSPVEKLKISGLFQPRYDFVDDTTKASSNGFKIRRFEFKLATELNDWIGFDLNYDFSPKSTGGTGDLRDAILRFKLNDFAKISVGQFKKPVLKEEFLTGAGSIRLVDRGLLAKWLTDNNFAERDLGIGINGDTKKLDIPVSYWAGIFNGNGKNNASDNNSAKQIVAHLEYKPLDFLTVGGGFTTIGYNNNFAGSSKNKSVADSTKSKTQINWQTAFGGNVELVFGDLSVISEYYQFDNAKLWESALPAGARNVTAVNVFRKGVEAYGYYINPLYLIKLDSETFPKVDFGAKYEVLDPDKNSDKNTITEITVGTSLYFHENGSRIQFNYLVNTDETRKLKKLSENVNTFVVQSTFKF